MIRDGWHRVGRDIQVYVWSDYIQKVLTTDYNNGWLAASIYKKNKAGELVRSMPMKFTTFKRHVKDGRYIVR